MKISTIAVAVCLSVLAALRTTNAQAAGRHPPRDSVLVLERVTTTAYPTQYSPVHVARQAIRDATRDSLLLELAAGHERWAKQGAPRISYRVQELCFCPTIGDISASTTILAVGDSVHAVVNAIGEPTQSLYPNDGRPSIPFLFERAEAAIRGNADGIVVTFHPIFGFPTRVAVDRRVNVTDDELDIVVSHISLVP